MPRVIKFPPAEDARDAQSWAAFAAEDAAVRVPSALEARVLRAAQQALAEQRRAEIERRRRVWHAAGAAVAAGILAAAAWSLAPASTSTSAPRAADGAPPAPAPAPIVEIQKGRGGRVPMTNVEAGRMLGTLPRAALVSRPLFDPSDVGLVRAPMALRSKSFGAAPIAHATSGAQMAEGASAPPPDALPVVLPSATQAVTPPVVEPATAAQSSRGFRGIDPATGKPAEPAYRLERAPDETAPPPPPPKERR